MTNGADGGAGGGQGRLAARPADGPSSLATADRRRIGNRVIALLAVAAIVALALLPFVSIAPNRIVSGTPAMLWKAAAAPLSLAVAVELAALLGLSLIKPTRTAAALAAVTGALLLVTLVLAAGSSGLLAIAATGAKGTRTGLGAGFWIAVIAAALAVSDALGRLRLGTAARFAAGLALALAVAAIAWSGALDQLSIVREYLTRRDGFTAELARHIALVFGALLPAIAIGGALGALVLRRRTLRGPVFATLNVIQTVPSIALFGLLIGPLTGLSEAWPFLREIGIRGIGYAPAVIALTLYGLLPVARSTEAAFLAVPPAVVDAARGMGMTGGQILRNVSLPLALPILLSGLRIVTIQLIGLAVVAALIGAGGLGTFVFQGLGQTATDLVLLGALSAIGLALLADGLLRSLTAALTGKGITP
ncbi:ABC transporter permease [Segnochrobactrum spirostomi]|uniref:ABC transporter permease n=1 Tax=Segnochrobactrum spirostomi TaxID=2608987 RepID=A0A6A7Y350_9HYPH|nr:ABC transporter permease [Segnochrobactrum spirostomi]MQT13540.1 ABC transporter permease [Segnochrobactrum spirostomi]